MSFWNSRKRKSRKKYGCEYCGKVIEIGEVYSRETGIYEGEFNDYCLCERCADVIQVMKGEDSWEVGSFADDLFDTDMLKCPNCHKNSLREHDFSEDMLSIAIECDECENKYTVNLSESAIKKYFGDNVNNNIKSCYEKDIKSYYKNLKDGRCKGCSHARAFIGGGVVFLGCYHEPYRGKWVAEIKNCPKSGETANE